MPKNNVHLYNLILEGKSETQDDNIKSVWQKHRKDLSLESFRRMFFLWKRANVKRSDAPKMDIKSMVQDLIKKKKHE